VDVLEARNGADPFNVVIAGGGVAGAEALLCLRDLVGGAASVEMISAEREVPYKALSLAEPFGLGDGRSLRLDKLAGHCEADFHQDRLSGVDPEHRTAQTEAGIELSYDALLLAVGVHQVVDLAGALTYGGPATNAAYRELLSELEAGEVRSVAFAAPATIRWALPIYELALLTAGHLRREGREGVELTLVTPEVQPLEMFGRRASESVSALLAEAGIAFRASSAPAAVEAEELILASGERLQAERVVALPRLEVQPIPGVPQGPRGFIGTDAFMRVEGLPRVLAAGDATWFPIKQGGLAAQQADCAATTIASLINPEIGKAPFRPVLRAALLTSDGPRYLRSSIGERNGSSAGGAAPLWWPPSKIAARYLAPYIAHEGEPDPSPPLSDLPALHGEDVEQSVRDHQEAVELALRAADADARWQDLRNALRWLDVAEQLNLTLPPGYARKRRQWAGALEEMEPG
jgi:sulfide:quinone oxidoreductase